MENVLVEGDSWLQVSIDRNSRGIELFVRVDPRVEEFIRTVSDTELDKITEYGQGWTPVPADTDFKVYRMIQELSTPVYLFGNVGGTLINAKTKQTNLSFLQFQGVGDQGVRFSMAGPFGRDYVKELSESILKASHVFVRNYIVPVGIHLKLFSKEV